MTIMTTTASSKSPVLVILPPTHKCPDLERVLKLARKAFDDLSLNILDLNLRFAWVSGDELQSESTEDGGPAHQQTNGSPPANDTVNPNHPALPQARAEPEPATIWPAPPTEPPIPPPPAANGSAGVVRKLSVKEADLNSFRIFFSDIAPTMSDADILGMCPPDIEIVGATFYPPRPLGYNKSMVRSVVFAFAKAKHAKDFQTWLTKEFASGALAGKLLTRNALTMFLRHGVEVGELLSEPNKSALLGPYEGSLDRAAPSASVPPAAVPNDLPEARVCDWSLVAGNFIGTLSKDEIVAHVVPQGVRLTGATVYPPSRLGQGRSETVRFIRLAFPSKTQAHACHAWIKEQYEAGGVVCKVITPNGKLSLNKPAAPRLAAGPRLSATHTLSATPTGHGPRTTIPPAVSSVTQHLASSATPSHPQQPGSSANSLHHSTLPLSDQILPAGIPEAQESHWRIRVGNLRPSASASEVFAQILHPRISLAGAAIHGTRALGTGRPELVSSLTLGFHSQSDASACRQWILSQADVDGRLADFITPAAKIYASAGVTPPDSASANGASTLAAPTVPISPPRLTNRSNADNEPPTTQHRLTVGNLLPTLSKVQVSSRLVPPGIAPVDLTLHNPVQLTGRPDYVMFVWIDFTCQRDLQTTHDWIRAQSIAGGRVAELLVPNAKVITILHKSVVAENASPSPSTGSTSKPTPPPPAAIPSLPNIADLPDASPNNFRLHVSNLDPDLELAQIIPALVPRDVKLVGASLFAPRPVGGSRRELVRSLKFAFLTEWDAKRCQQWIKQDLGGGVAKVALPGAKIGVGNPMDPMLADAPTDFADDEPAPPRNAATPLRPPAPSSTAHSPVSPAASPMPTRPDAASHPASRSPSVSSTTSSLPAPHPPLFHISLNGIDPAKPVSTIFSTILGSLKGPIEPARMGIRNADGRRGAEFVFDSEATAKQFVLQVWTGIKAGKYAGVTAEGEELKIVRGSSSRSGGE